MLLYPICCDYHTYPVNKRQSKDCKTYKRRNPSCFRRDNLRFFQTRAIELQDSKTGRPWSGSNSTLWIVGQSSKCKSCERFPRSSSGRSCTVISRGAARKFESGAPAIKRFASVALLLSPGRNLIWPRGFPSARNFSSCLCSSGERNEQMKNERTRWKKSWRKKRPDETRSTSLLPGGKKIVNVMYRRSAITS